jgi:WD40 repeat protein
VVKGWWSWMGLASCLASLSVGCTRSLAPSPPPPTGDRDGGAAVLPVDAASPGDAPGGAVSTPGDAGAKVAPPPTADAGADALPPRPAAHGDAGLAGWPLELDGACTVQVMPDRTLASSAGTLPAPGPYRPCDIIGGQSYSAVVASADGRRVAALGVGGQVQVLDARTLALIGTFARARGAYRAMAISGDGARIAAGDEQDGELDVWSVDDHALLLAADVGAAYPTSGGAVALSADGARAAAGSGNDTVVADVASGALRRYQEMRTCCTHALAFADGGRKLASARHGFGSTGSNDGSVALIDVATGAETLLIQHHDIYGGDTIAVSPDGHTVLTTRENVQLWDAATGAQRAELRPPEGGTFGVIGISADGASIATLFRDVDDSAGIWFQHRRASDGAVTDEIRLASYGTVLTWSPSDLLFGHTVGGVLFSVDTRAGRLAGNVCSFPTVDIGGFSRDGSRLFDRSTDHASILDAASGLPLRPINDGPAGLAVTAMSADGRRLAWVSSPESMGASRRLRVDTLTVDDGGHASFLSATAGEHSGVSLAFSGDGARLATFDTTMNAVDVFDVSGASQPVERSLPQAYTRLLGLTEDGSAVRLQRADTVDTFRWQDGVVVASWSFAQGIAATSFDAGTIVETGTSTSTVYRDGAPIATLPGTGWDCFGGGSFGLVSPDGGTVGIGFSCSRSWRSKNGPGTDVYDVATGSFVQRLPNSYPVFSWDGSRFAQGAVIWCR